MEATEANELSELGEEGHGTKSRTALTISILAMVLAISNLGGSNAMKESTQENILAANAYSFYQAKTVRQTMLKVAVSDLELQLAREPQMPAAVKELHQKKIEDYKKPLTATSPSLKPKKARKNFWPRPRIMNMSATTPCAKTLGSTMPRACCKLPLCCCQCPSSAV